MDRVLRVGIALIVDFEFVFVSSGVGFELECAGDGSSGVEAAGFGSGSGIAASGCVSGGGRP